MLCWKERVLCAAKSFNLGNYRRPKSGTMLRGNWASRPSGTKTIDVRRFYNSTDWPSGLAQINLGDRTVDMIQHQPTTRLRSCPFCDRNTALFSGDFLTR